MAELLVTLIVPPIAGLVAYFAIHRFWEREENAPNETTTRHEPSTANEHEKVAAQ